MTEAQVIDVIDGDTIKMELNGKIVTLRYIGIDAPERDEPLATQAHKANARLVTGRTIYLEQDVSETDRFGRLLRYVYLDDGTFVNAVLVRQGYAESRAYPPDTARQATLDAMEQEARAAGRGLWASGSTPGPPTSVSAAPTEAASTGRNVHITYIHYDGETNPDEPDEYAVIENLGDAPVNLRGYRLNADDEGQDFVFPDHVLRPGRVCRVYTDEDHPESCGFSFGHKGSGLWANGGECGHLYDPSGAEVSTYCY